jgi:hypothetical protein
LVHTPIPRILVSHHSPLWPCASSSRPTRPSWQCTTPRERSSAPATCDSRYQHLEVVAQQRNEQRMA